VGTIDVESEKVNAFSGRDESLLVACAEALQWLCVDFSILCRLFQH